MRGAYCLQMSYLSLHVTATVTVEANIYVRHVLRGHGHLGAHNLEG